MAQETRRRNSRVAAEEIPGNAPMTPMIDVVFQLLIFFLCTLQFPELEGKLVNFLPKHIGPGEPMTLAELEQVRIFLCADQGADLKTHRFHKARHDNASTKKNGELCAVVVEKLDLGMLYATSIHPDRARANRTLYVRISETVRGMIPREKTNGISVILDSDSEVPFEHVMGILNACKEQGIDSVEFVGNPRWAAGLSR